MEWKPIETASTRFDHVLLYDPTLPDGERIFTGYRDGPNWYDDGSERWQHHPSHWMPLPDPPTP